MNTGVVTGWKSVRESLLLMEEVTHRIASMIEPPQVVKLYGDKVAPRYSKQGLEQAIVPKMAGVVSSTRAALLLLEAHYYVEHSAVMRMAEEANEDIMFLARGLELGAKEAHQEFLDTFFTEYWQEGKNPELPDLISRPEFKRFKIRKYMDELHANGPALPGGINIGGLMKTSYVVDSGYVHGNCPQLMERYGGNPPKYHVAGIPDPSAMLRATLSLSYGVTRALITFATVARAFGDAALTEMLKKRADQLFRLSDRMQATFRAWEQSNPPAAATS